MYKKIGTAELKGYSLMSARSDQCSRCITKKKIKNLFLTNISNTFQSFEQTKTKRYHYFKYDT